MALANSSIKVAPDATGTDVATQTQSSKDYPAIMRADPAGHLIGSRDVYVFSAVAMAKAASKNYLTLYNSDATLTVEVALVYLNQELTAAVTGLVRGYRLFRCTSAPTAGTTLTAVKVKSASAVSLTNIVGRRDGVTATAVGDPLGTAGVGEEETGAGGAAPHVLWSEAIVGEPIVLAQNEGIVVQQDSTAGTGLLSAVCVFRVRAN